MRRERKWWSVFVGADGKLAVVTIGFLIWMLAVTGCWTYLTIAGAKLIELPATVVHLTLALGATKVTHKLAENDWGKIVAKIVEFFKNRSRKKV